MTNVTVKNCASYKSTMPGNGGGAIYAKGNVTLTATDCTFENNAVKNTGFGGAVYAQSATVVLDDCTFTGNSAPTGGAVAASGSANLTVTNSTFSGNDGTTGGGNDIYLFDGKTPTKPNQFSNSAVSFALSGNTYQDDSAATELKGYSVVLGRYYEDGYAGNGSDVVLLDGLRHLVDEHPL
jgi:predicted outer membrane repeat protein